MLNVSKLLKLALYVISLTYSVFAFGQVVWLSSPIVGSTNYSYASDGIPDNGLSASDISTEEVCRVTLVGTNTVQVSNFLGMTNWPDVASDWWSIYDARGGFKNTNDSSIGQLHTKALSDPNYNESKTDLETLGTSHSSDTNAFSAPDLTGLHAPEGDGGGDAFTAHLIIGGVDHPMDFDPLNNDKIKTACDFIKFMILAVLGCAVGVYIFKDWQVMMGRLQDAKQAAGYGDSILGNAAPNLFAQINAALITVLVSAGCVVITSAAFALLSAWVLRCLDSCPTSIAIAFCWHLFNGLVPVAGIMGILGLWVGWQSMAVGTEYMLKLLVRHVTT